ncbi:MAG TPA: MerR family transcriptional regulator [Tepidiformaceae bacterium]|nr:MerR family transcriptional regulator [Tepidiformaceae bacterium]
MSNGSLPPEPLRIAEVVRLTGVSLHTLRAWERRYGVPEPERTGGQHRMYSHRDVEAVRQMSAFSRQGMPLAKAAARVRAEQQNDRPPATLAEGIASPLAARLLQYDEAGAAAEWTAALDVFDLQSAFQHVLVPLMRQVGQAWHDGEASVAQEHFATNFVRSRLDAIGRQVLPLPNAPVALLACLEGEHHELGLLMLAVMLRHHGFRTIYLGQDVPNEALIRCVEDSQPSVLVVNAGMVEGTRHLRTIASALPESAPLTTLVYGGGAFDAEPSLRDESHGTYGGPDLETAVRLITQVGRERPIGGSK